MTASPARITQRRRLEWIDTDAAGVHHWTSVFRLVESAEAALHDRLGILERTFGRTPRVHVSCDFRRELHFFELVEVVLEVAEVGRTSVRYRFTVRGHEAEGEAAAGELVVVHVSEQPGGRPTPWPDPIRTRLEEGGDQGVVTGA